VRHVTGVAAALALAPAAVSPTRQVVAQPARGGGKSDRMRRMVASFTSTAKPAPAASRAARREWAKVENGRIEAAIRERFGVTNKRAVALRKRGVRP
jgi:23S rRNA U2552 (ribose-2'-O)-methylase RlmE/FtsJ